MFTRQHYEKIAKILGQGHLLENTESQMNAVGYIADQLISMFIEDNERFDPQKFRNAIDKAYKEAWQKPA